MRLDFWTATRRWIRDRFPRSVVILGGGAIALEFAHFYNALGLEVTVLQRSNQVIKEADSDIAEALVSAFRKRGIKVICGTKLMRVERTATGKRVWYERDGEEKVAEADEIFYALGRKPAVQGLGLEKAGVETDKQNAVVVNDRLQTSQPHIFAAGDVTGLYEIVHIAIQQGEIGGPECEAFTGRQRSGDHRLSSENVHHVSRAADCCGGNH